MATSRNVFDQFDAPEQGNVFDQFDAKTTEQSGHNVGSILKNFYGAQYEPLASLGSSMVAAPIAGLAGIGQGLKNLVSPGIPAADRVGQVAGAMTYQPRTDAGKAVTGALSYPFEKLAQLGDAAGDAANAPDEGRPKISAAAANYGLDPIVSQVRSPEERAAEGALFNTAVQSLPSLLLRGRANPAEVGGNGIRSSGVGGGVAAGEKPAPARAASTAERPSGLASVSGEAPTKEQLRAAADAAYKRADEIGAVARSDSFGDAKQSITAMLEKEGIDPTLHPKTTAALKRITDTNGPVTIQKLETLRRIAQDAESSIEPADKRLAGKTVDAIDDYAESLTEEDLHQGSPEAIAALKEARSYWSRMRKADTIDDLMERAELSAPNFSASGMENAVRTEFRSLAKDKRRMRFFTAEEKEAIRRVAKGDTKTNVLRLVGKLAPTGVVSTALSTGLGAVLGGPVGAAAVPAAGFGARMLATRGTLRNAAAANELVRRGPVGVLAGEPIATPPTRGVLAP